MSTHNAIDLSALDPPDIIEEVEFEVVLKDTVTDLKTRDDSLSATVESDPSYKILETSSYRETLIRKRINNACKAVMLAYTKGADLENLAAIFNMKRFTLIEEQPDALPPVAEVMEPDEDFLERVLLVFESLTTAGSDGSYKAHGRNADPDVKDIGVDSPSPGVVRLSVLSKTGDGTASSELQAKVEAALSDEFVRPLTDNVIVQSATIIDYTITASLEVKPGASVSLILEAAENSIQSYVKKQHMIKETVAISGVYAALHEQAGVVKVILISPTQDIETDTCEAAFCSSISITEAI